MAPELGVPLNTESGISGECLRAAHILFCHDALSDERVDIEVCRAMGVRSIVAVPLHGDAGMAGILEAFSSRPNAFDGDALNSLRALSEIAEAAYARERGEIWCAVPATAVPKAAKPFPPTVVKQDGKITVQKKLSGRIWIIAGVAIALLLTFSVAWWSWHQPAEEIESSGQNAHPADTGTNPSSQSPQRVATPKPGPGIPAFGNGNRRLDRLPAKNLLRNAAVVQAEPGLPTSSEPALPASSENRVAEAPSESKSASMESESPPTIDLARAAIPESTAPIATVPAKLPKLDAQISQGVTEPKLIHKVDPGYPPQARARRLTGKVIVDARIGEDGLVREATVVSGLPELAEASKAAIRQWRYSPALLNGNPVEVQKQVTFVFTLPQ